MIITSKITEALLQQKYSLLTKGQFAGLAYPEPFIPTIMPADILILRYFAKKINDVFVYEVSKTNYNALITTAFYNLVTLNWKVRGIPHTTIDPIDGETQGVAEYNQVQLDQAESSVTGISKKMINLLDLYQGLK